MKIINTENGKTDGNEPIKEIKTNKNIVIILNKKNKELILKK